MEMGEELKKVIDNGGITNEDILNYMIREAENFGDHYDCGGCSDALELIDRFWDGFFENELEKANEFFCDFIEEELQDKLSDDDIIYGFQCIYDKKEIYDKVNDLLGHLAMCNR